MSIVKSLMIVCLCFVLYTTAYVISNPYDDFPVTSDEEDQDIQLELFSKMLLQLLREPWSDEESPLLYIEEPSSELSNDYQNVPLKRSRYFRRNSWKRQNLQIKGQKPYDSLICHPSREEVFRLLVALHESRAGNNRPLNFCNRRRYPNTIYTHIRIAERKK